MATSRDVISGAAVWHVECGDCLEWMRTLPDGCCSLTMTSPPYLGQRSYGIGFKMQSEEWVAWMIPRVVEMCRVTDGLVCVNMSAPVQNHSYQPAPELLVADLIRHHGIVCAASPYVYFRFGIPGSGGKRYHRRDWEPVYCFCRPEVLPLKWSDNVSCGHKPKWAPGGEMSNRLSDGARVNQWGGRRTSAATLRENGNRQPPGRPSHDYGEPAPGLFGEVEEVLVNPWNGSKPGRNGECGVRADGSGKVDTSRALREGFTAQEVAKAVANPGNVVREKYPYIQRVLPEDQIALPDFIGILMLYGQSTKTNAGSILYDLQEATRAQAISRWFRGVYTTVLGQAVLRPDLYGFGRKRVADLRLPGLQEAVQATPPWAGLLQRCVQVPAGGPDATGQPESRQEGQSEDRLRSLRDNQATLHSPQGREPLQQQQVQSGSRVPILSQPPSQAQGDLLSVRETADGARLLSQAFAQIQDVWRSAYEEAIALARSRESGRLETFDAEHVRQLLESLITRRDVEYGDVIRCLVGGGRMGSKSAHESEAPFPETLVEFFVRSYAKPGSIVLDPFGGSGTTAAVAVRLGRRSLSCDVREGQCEIARKRVAAETPDLFAGRAD